MIRLSKSSISEKEKSRVTKVLDKEYLGMGEEVAKFEENLTSFIGRQVVCVSSGTSALHLALQAAGISKGDEVLVPSLTYVASYQAISATGAVPISCDIQENDLTICIEDCIKRITKRTKAIMPVFYSGGTGNIEKLYKFAKKFNLRVIEDAAHAFGTTVDSKLIGSFGDISCFSFDGIKNITSGEGGAIVTDDQKVLSLVKDARLLGVIKDSNKRNLNQRSWDFEVKHQGWRYHMSNVMAAIGIEQLKRFPEMSKKRKEIASLYQKKLKNSPLIKTLDLNYDFVVPHIFPIIIPKMIKRDNLREEMLNEEIETGIHWKPNHCLEKYSSSNELPLKVTEKLFPNILTLPLHADLTIKELDKVCHTLISKLETNEFF
jgi:dTDP-4-amino-4,6-dideoxygalactose transaminase